MNDDAHDDTFMSGEHEAPPTEPGDDATLAPSGERAAPRGDGPEKFELGKELARGGMGRVLEARDVRLARPVAVKQLLNVSPQLLARFEREVRITARLQHPSIVPVYEAGQNERGEPWFAMKLLAGRTLADVVQATPPEARLGLLPRVIALSEALAYAHGQRIIHRDLKPANVIVGEFGETVVIDWGVAKDLLDDAPEPSSELMAGVAGSLTQVGSIFGTPSYMPPEQGRGEPIDERADVYSLGALLYEVLSGRPPYTANTALEVLGLLKAGPPTPLAQVAPNTPPELVSIVNRAMAREPSDRYPTAREFVAELQQFQTGKLVSGHSYSAAQLVRRWVARNRAPLMVAAVSAVLLVGLSALALWRIIDARRQAEQRRGQVESLLDVVVFDLNQQLAPLGRLDLLAQLSKQAEAYYQSAPPTDDEDLERRAKAWSNLSTVASAQGEHARARAAAEAAVTMRADLANRRGWPADVLRLCDSQAQLADVLMQAGELHAGLAQLELAAHRCDPLASSTGPHDKEIVSRTHRLKSTALLEQAPAAARAEAEAAAQVFANVTLDEPGDALEFAKTQDALSAAALAQGDVTVAASALERGRAVREKLVAKDPSNATWLAADAEGNWHLGELAERQGDSREALTAFNRSLAVRDQLVKLDPTNLETLRRLSESLERVVTLLAARGDSDESFARAQQMLGIDERLVTTAPGNLHLVRDLTVTRNLVGLGYLERGRVTEATRQFEQSLSDRERLATLAGESADTLSDVAAAQQLLGEAALARGEPSKARAAFAAAVRAAERALKLEPSLEAELDVAISQQGLASAALALGEFDTAEQALRGAAERLNAASGSADADGLHERERVKVTNARLLAQALLHRGAAAEAQTELERGLEVAQALVAVDRENAEWTNELTALLDQLGVTLTVRGPLPRAQEVLEQALALDAKVNPGAPSASRAFWRAMTHSHLATVHQKARRPAEAKREWQLALSLFTPDDEVLQQQAVWRERLAALRLAAGP